MDFHQLTARLPTGKESFVDIRRSGAVYVDKTPLVYKIARVRSPQIVTRPRLFGKSTLASTLEELFLHGVATYDCHDSYFKGWRSNRCGRIKVSIWCCALTSPS